MPEDLITGVLILQRFPDSGDPKKPNPPYGLWFQYTRGDGLIGHSYIPVKEKGTATPENLKGPLWEFVSRSPWMDVTPSVRILGATVSSPDHFHNQGFWSNHYVQMAHDYGTEPDAYTLIREINEPTTKEGRDAVILPYRAKGVFL